MRVKHTVLQKTEKTNTKSPTKSDTIYYGDYNFQWNPHHVNVC